MVLIMVWRPRGLIVTRVPSVFLKKHPEGSKPIHADLVKEAHG
jgi:branched-chain amino acid transport system permease protein